MSQNRDITIQIKGVRPIPAQVVFMHDGFLLNNEYQPVVTCILKSRGLILGTGVAVCAPGDSLDWDTGNRLALKRAASYNLTWVRLLNKQEMAAICHRANPVKVFSDSVFSAWRKSFRPEPDPEPGESEE